MSVFVHNFYGSCRAWASMALARSLCVGAVATVADMGVLAILIWAMGIRPGIANAPALAVGLVVQFFGNKRFAFRNTDPATARQALRFARVEAVAFLLNLASFHVLAVWISIPFVFARPMSEVVVYLGFSFPQWRRIFGRSQGPSDLPPNRSQTS